MINYEKGIVNLGNNYRLKAVMQRAEKGERITVGFLGGSITQGSLATKQELCYASLVYGWWKKNYPNVDFINAGIGGTSSQFGVARVQDDLLRYHVDVVFVEFSVNDENNSFFQETYEGLIRKIWKSGAAIILIHNVRYDNMYSAEDVHLQVGKHYHLPCISMKSSILPEVTSGRIPNHRITPDDLHPNDEGHAMVAAVIIHYLDSVRNAEMDMPEDELPLPITPNQYETSTRYQRCNSEPESNGFVPDETPQEHITQMFRNGFTAAKKGDRITFHVIGSELAIQYRKSVRKPAPIARAIVDDNVDSAVILDANFQENWGDCLYIDNLLVHGEQKLHKVVVEIIEDHADDVVPFYLVAIIGSSTT